MYGIVFFKLYAINSPEESNWPWATTNPDACSFTTMVCWDISYPSGNVILNLIPDVSCYTPFKLRNSTEDPMLLTVDPVLMVAFAISNLWT